jgi:chemotaxis response regulator CheB
VILSGTDGTLGLAEIQAQGGVTFAQDESMATVAGPTPRDS